MASQKKHVQGREERAKKYAEAIKNARESFPGLDGKNRQVRMIALVQIKQIFAPLGAFIAKKALHLQQVNQEHEQYKALVAELSKCQSVEDTEKVLVRWSGYIHVSCS